MADQKSLSFIGFMLGGVTAAVMSIGVFVVHSHLDGRLTLDDAQRPVIAVALPKIVR
jgi:hypothetical protein